MTSTGTKFDIFSLQKDANIGKLIIATMVAIIPGFSNGVTMVFSGVSLLIFRDPERTPLNYALTEDQGSWFVSILSIANLIGCLCSGMIAEKLGRKLTLLISNVIIISGWASVHIARNFLVLMIGRILMGIGCGMGNSGAYIYLSEITLIRFRSYMSNLNTLSINIGFIYGLGLGIFFDIKMIMILSSLPALFFIPLSYFVPESPLWLAKTGQTEKAEKVISWLRGPKYCSSIEVEEIIFCTSLKQANEFDSSFSAKVKYFTSKNILLPIALAMLVFFFQVGSGSDTICYYCYDLFSRADFHIESGVLAFFQQIGMTGGFLIATPLSKYMPRKPQYILSGIIASTSFLCLGYCIKVQKDAALSGEEIHEIYRILPPICIISFCVGYGIGFGSVSFGLLGEFFPTQIRGIGASIALSTRALSVFVFLKFYPTTISLFGLHGLFFMHTVICIVAFIFYTICIPETKGLTLTQVEKLFMNAKDRKAFEEKEALNRNIKPPKSFIDKAEMINEIHKKEKSIQELFNNSINKN